MPRLSYIFIYVGLCSFSEKYSAFEIHINKHRNRRQTKTVSFTYVLLCCRYICIYVMYTFFLRTFSVPDHDRGRPKKTNACILITHMVYL